MEEMIETQLSRLSCFEFRGEETEFGNKEIRKVGGFESVLPWKARSEGRRPKERRFTNRRHGEGGRFGKRPSLEGKKRRVGDPRSGGF